MEFSCKLHKKNCLMSWDAIASQNPTKKLEGQIEDSAAHKGKTFSYKNPLFRQGIKK